MFNNQNQQSTDENGAPANNTSEADFTIRTMKSDLAKLNPRDMDNQTAVKQQEPSGATFERISDVADNSPFLNTNYSSPKDDVMPPNKPSGMYMPERNISTNAAPTQDKVSAYSDVFRETSAPAPAPNQQSGFAIKPEDIQQQTAQTDAQETASGNPFLSQEEILENQPQNGNLNWGTVLIVTLSLLIIVTLGIGGYYFWITQDSNDDVAVIPPVDLPVEQPAPEPTPEPEPEPTPEPEPSPNIFQSDRANLLAINPEIDDAKTTADLLLSTAAKVKEQGLTSPIEFIPVDTNGNSISFVIFSMIVGINLPTSVMASLEETFSLYFYNDQGNMRMALTVDLDEEKGPATLPAMKASEPTLVSSIQPLLLGNTIEFKNKPFSDGQHKNYAIRYVNLNSLNDLSIDYTVAKEQLIIGTSKDSVRAVIDIADAQPAISE